MSAPRARSLVCCSFVAALVGTSAGGAHASQPARGYVEACPLESGHRLCDAKVVTDGTGVPLRNVSGTDGGFTASDLASAYGVAANGGAGRVVAVWGGNNDLASAESDLGVYRAQFGLSPCTTANGCFQKLDQSGGVSYPPPQTSQGYQLEQVLDLEMASAGCPSCNIIFIEGDISASLATARRLGAAAFSTSISISFGSDATNASICQSQGWDDTSSGMLVTAAAGDGGYPSFAPAVPTVCQGVVAVGGTTLAQDSSARGWSEVAWSSTGSGCSDAEAKPPWETDPSCPMRMVNDVSADADCNSAIAVYASAAYGGWVQACGTSAATPLVAALFTAVGLANGSFSPAWIWQNSSAFNDVTTGSNGTCSGEPSYVCNAGPGYDGPTGWGSPNGQLIAGLLATTGPSDAGGDGSAADGGGASDGPSDAMADASRAPSDAGRLVVPDASLPGSIPGPADDDASNAPSAGGCGVAAPQPTPWGWLMVAAIALACMRGRARSKGGYAMPLVAIACAGLGLALLGVTNVACSGPAGEGTRADAAEPVAGCSLDVSKNSYSGSDYWGTIIIENAGASKAPGFTVAFDVPSGAHCTNDAVTSGGVLSPLEGSGASAKTTSNHCVFTFAQTSISAGSTHTIHYSTDSSSLTEAANVTITGSGCGGTPDAGADAGADAAQPDAAQQSDSGQAGPGINGAFSTACQSASSSTCSTYLGSCSSAPWAVPGQIEAENYDLCGQNGGYYDTTSGNAGGSYRNDDVDIETTTDTGGGYDVGWIAAGEWLKYSASVAATGSYQVQMRVASTDSGQTLHLESDGVNVTGTLTAPNTGDWETWTTITSPPFTLTAGDHILTLAFETGDYNINWIDIQPAGGGGSDGGSDSGGTSTTDYAPYFPTWSWNGGSSYAYQNLVGLQQASGLHGVTIAFVLSNGGCDTTQDIEQNQSDVNAFIANGGHVKASFGGADGTYVESKCSSAQAWAQAMESFVDSTGITDLDFDIEEPDVMTNSMNQMRGQALLAVQQARNIKVSLTIDAGDPTSGLDPTNLAVVKACIEAGVTISHVNIMTMDYGDSSDPVAPVAIDSLNAVHNQLMQNISGLSSPAAWTMLGVTPMIGRNDDTEVFSLADARQLSAFVRANHVGLLAFWSIDRDQVCPNGADYNSCTTVDTSNFQFNAIFNAP